MRVGVDLIEIERVRRALQRHPQSFRERCFTEAERAYCDSKANPPQHYAARFAGKEAVGKALGSGVHFTWREIEIRGRPKPGVYLSGRTKAWAERVGAGRIELSMTHSKELAAAIAVVQPVGPAARYDNPSPSTLGREELKSEGFVGFVTFEALREGGFAQVPEAEGTYVVLREAMQPPEFLEASIGGRFKGEDPTVPVATLEARWVAGASVLYIGKAGSSTRGKGRLRARLQEYAAFGAGRSVRHRDRRFIWQLADSAGLLVAWRECRDDETAREAEARLLSDFKRAYGRLPFANIADQSIQAAGRGRSDPPIV